MADPDIDTKIKELNRPYFDTVPPEAYGQDLHVQTFYETIEGSAGYIRGHGLNYDARVVRQRYLVFVTALIWDSGYTLTDYSPKIPIGESRDLPSIAVTEN